MAEGPAEPDRPAVDPRDGQIASSPRSRQIPAYPEPLQRLLEELERLPGIGRRSAERIAFHLLRGSSDHPLALARAITDVARRVSRCRVCSGLAEAELCSICDDPRRDRATVLVVEQPKDLIALEQTAMFGGVYHVLMGRLSPLDGIGPEDLTIDALLHRIDDPNANCGAVPVVEVVLGLNPTVEGDGTMLFLAQELKPRGVRVSRLARGLPTGWSLEHANKAVLADAIQGRQRVE